MRLKLIEDKVNGNTLERLVVCLCVFDSSDQSAGACVCQYVTVTSNMNLTESAHEIKIFFMLSHTSTTKDA